MQRHLCILWVYLTKDVALHYVSRARLETSHRSTWIEKCAKLLARRIARSSKHDHGVRGEITYTTQPVAVEVLFYNHCVFKIVVGSGLHE